ncbi:carbamoyl-phosphate synthase large subunit [Candidatus Tremblaya phenacola]|uniref:carbamoyl-phosphate synthase large subunit n=1 Tax=Candidatus Tremblayella phenacoccinincola TaxID=1010676 RepID=UPI001330F311|nr:carbamoyl-phosphate synthase large subunit [Candidatus Tremblaya phenacola]KAH0998310.1 Carbamoyl-phosphate synthase large chain [Candidatus Tremblaya phenacola]
MPKRTDINSIVVLGAGPITIGQACEFDYSGTQACQALFEEGLRVSLINSNPATIMTDPNLAHSTYIEPMNVKTIAEILRKEKPDAILATMGGQTALNCLRELNNTSVLKDLDIECIGVTPDSIERTENRQLFKNLVKSLGLNSALSGLAHTVDEALRVRADIESKTSKTHPIIVRPSFTLGGAGGGVAYDKREFVAICKAGFRMSPVSEVLIEESLLGWKEYELEIVKDYNNNCMVVCTIENIDPMGIHTGDSMTVAPAQTLTDKEYQSMRKAAFAIVNQAGIQSGSCNVQFALCPQSERMVVVEMNPRVSRSSALASKATGFPIARISTKLAVGYSLEELKNRSTSGCIPAAFEPTVDYIVTKLPRFTFEKFPGVEPVLNTQMQSVGEVMAIGRSFPESFQKSLRSLDYDVHVLELQVNIEKILTFLSFPGPKRLLYIMKAFRVGLGINLIYERTCIDKWFLFYFKHFSTVEVRLLGQRCNSVSRREWRTIKQLGLSDHLVSKLWNVSEDIVVYMRRALNVFPSYKRIDTCAAEFPVKTAYLYSTYEGVCESNPGVNNKVAVIGSGPNRIGQGLEFDYCCVHSVIALKNRGFESIMINCNPETVSTDYDIPNKLYFEPLTIEDVEEVSIKEKPCLVIIQFGGQTPLRIAKSLNKRSIRLLGSSAKAIELTENREQFKIAISRTSLKQPKSFIANSKEESIAKVRELGYPVIVRPSYVLGGSNMKILHDEADLRWCVNHANSLEFPKVLIERFLTEAVECDIDCVCDGVNIIIPGIMEHVEQAGVHSGDSANSLPPRSISPNTIMNLKEQTQKLAKVFKIVGLMNIQFAIQSLGTNDERIFVLEVNPRAARTIPYVSKSIGLPLVNLATRVMVKGTLGFETNIIVKTTRCTIKESVLPFAKFPHIDPMLGPEMRSTGEVMGVGRTFGEAWLKSQASCGFDISESKGVLFNTDNKEKLRISQIARLLSNLGFKLFGTKHTSKAIRSKGLNIKESESIEEGVTVVISTSKRNASLRLIAKTTGVPYYSTIRGGLAFVEGCLSVNRLRTCKLQTVAGISI